MNRAIVEDEDIAQPAKGRVVGDHPQEADLLAAGGVDSDQQAVLERLVDGRLEALLRPVAAPEIILHDVDLDLRGIV
jgi:hypothetical protein